MENIMLERQLNLLKNDFPNILENLHMKVERNIIIAYQELLENNYMKVERNIIIAYQELLENTVPRHLILEF